jgi:hypothetical protein
MGVGVDADTLSKALRLGLRRDRAGPRGRARQTRAAHQASPPGMGDTLGELSAEVEADCARIMASAKWRNCAGCSWNCQGHRRARKRIKLARRQRLCTPFQRFADQSQA